MNWRAIRNGIVAAIVTLLAAHVLAAFIYWEWWWVSEWSEAGRAFAGSLALGIGAAIALVED